MFGKNIRKSILTKCLCYVRIRLIIRIGWVVKLIGGQKGHGNVWYESWWHQGRRYK